MSKKTTYRVSVYTERGTRLVGDNFYSSRTIANKDFMTVAGAWIKDSHACVLLSRGTTTLAAKSTDDDRVVYHRAYYSM
jgi:hypothetical protein